MQVPVTIIVHEHGKGQIGIIRIHILRKTVVYNESTIPSIPHTKFCNKCDGCVKTVVDPEFLMGAEGADLVGAHHLPMRGPFEMSLWKFPLNNYYQLLR